MYMCIITNEIKCTHSFILIGLYFTYSRPFCKRLPFKYFCHHSLEHTITRVLHPFRKMGISPTQNKERKKKKRQIERRRNSDTCTFLCCCCCPPPIPPQPPPPHTHTHTLNRFLLPN